MDILEVIKIRRSIREYTNNPLPKEILEKIIDAARFAPTARGVEPWEFIVITQPDTLKKIGEIAENGKFVSHAVACIAVFCSDTKYYLEDGCAATENILLAAAALGIASCWIAGDKKPYCNQIGDLLGVPGSFKLVSIVSLGYPESDKVFKVTRRRSVKDVTHWEKF